jgi:hypothetical protein
MPYKNKYFFVIARKKYLFTPFRIYNAENVSPLSLKTPSKVGVSNEKWCKKRR